MTSWFEQPHPIILAMCFGYILMSIATMIWTEVRKKR